MTIAVDPLRRIDCYHRSIAVLSTIMDDARLSWWRCIVVVFRFVVGLDR